jgi:hypothetical protein
MNGRKEKNLKLPCFIREFIEAGWIKANAQEITRTLTPPTRHKD